MRTLPAAAANVNRYDSGGANTDAYREGYQNPYFYPTAARRVLPWRGLPGVLAALLLLGGCAPTAVNQVSAGGAPVPRPARILVYNFAVSADEVELDKGFSPELIQQYENELSGPARTAAEIQVGHNVADAVSEELVKKLQGYGLNVQWANAATPLDDRSIIIKGQFVTIDEGNRTGASPSALAPGAPRCRPMCRFTS
ncbi:MAG: DUF4410 domain-containing protein [Halioglobus sp.]